MAAKKATCKTLKSVETLGSASIICSDKTGTLTKGEMTCVQFATMLSPDKMSDYKVAGSGYAPDGEIEPREQLDSDPAAEQLLAAAGLCNGADLSYDQGKTYTQTDLSPNNPTCAYVYINYWRPYTNSF